MTASDPSDPDETPTRHGDLSGSEDYADDETQGGTVPSTEPGEFAGAVAGGSEALIGKVIGGCRVDRILGRGAMGAVYRARQLKLDRDVAVKVIRPEMMTDPRMLKRFEFEARTVGQFNSAHVVMVHDVGFEHDVHYLVMEFVSGTNLREHVKLLAGGRLPAGEALPLIRQACKGLEEARRVGVVHRDIKPDNLMLTDQGVLKIADFGIAKPIQDDMSVTMTSELIGTPLYMSPEQCHGDAEVDFRSDMYSLGATFYYLLTGEPPIRASSVYELIQTKTRLENLCLWKALPELDENHPLSRVIERMTANDPLDRYDSYEELLNDLLLVEAGETIHIKQRSRKRKQGDGDRAAKSRSSWPIVATAAILLAAGAGYGWYAWFGGDSDPVAPRDPNKFANTEPVDDVDAARQRLARLRDRLRDDGPTISLQQDFLALSLPAAVAADRASLARDIEIGRGVADRLAELQKPGELQPPFDGLQQYFADVTTAAQVSGDVGSELRTWLQSAVSEARAEQQLGAEARAALNGAFVRWQNDRRSVGNDDKRLAELREQLDAIQTGRQVLFDSLPAQRGALADELPLEAIDRARMGLAVPTNVLPQDVDVSTALAEIAAELERLGPNDSLANRAEELRPTRPEQVSARDELLNAIQIAREARTLAQATRTDSFPAAPQPPFDDVVDYYQRLDRALLSQRANDGALPLWAENMRSRLRAQELLQQGVVDACLALHRDWQRLTSSGAAAVELDREAQRLRQAITRATELFPAAGPLLSEAIPAEQLAGELAAARNAAELQGWRESLQQLRRTVADVRSLEGWGSVATDVDGAIEALRTQSQELELDQRSAQQLRLLEAECGRWRTAAARLVEAAAHLAGADLTACEGAIRGAATGAAGRTELQQLGQIAARCRAAFEDLDRKLDLAAATSNLAVAMSLVDAQSSLPPAVAERIRRWQLGVEDLGRATVGMVPIAAGQTVNPAANVDAFFIDATECSKSQFRAFVAELKAAARGSSPAEQLAAVEARLAGVGMRPQALVRLAAKEVVGADDEPIDRVLWTDAAAFAAWNRKALPTAAEWALAAFGDQNQYRFPWGKQWSNEPKQRNPSASKLMAVDDGGLSWRSSSGPPLHHLAGNVAEWLAAPEGDRAARTAGGRYNLRGLTDAKEQASGKKYPARGKDDTVSGIGFRTVLRVRTFPGLDWPR